MKALVHHGPNETRWDEVPDPELIAPTDIVASVEATTICGSDLHILKGHLPESRRGGYSATRPLQSSKRLVHRCVTSIQVTASSFRASRPVADADSVAKGASVSASMVAAGS
jgi:alcohol dehydrogenase